MGLICLFTSVNGFREALAVNMSFISGFIIIIIIIIMVLMNIFEDGSKPQRISPSQGYNTQHRNLRSRGYNQQYRNLSITKIQTATQEPPITRIQPAVQEPLDHEGTNCNAGSYQTWGYNQQYRNLPITVQPAIAQELDRHVWRQLTKFIISSNLTENAHSSDCE